MAAQKAFSCLSKQNVTIVIDGRDNWLPNVAEVRTQVKADRDVLAVAAASVLAKQLRDNYMIQMGRIFPEYGFESHVGYGTKQHMEALRNHGITSLHRKSYKPIQEIILNNEALEKS